MDLNQIFVFFTKWMIFILLSLLPYLISLSSKLFCVGNEPNGGESNICFNKVEAIYPFITNTLSDIINFKIILFRQWTKWSWIKYLFLTKWRLFILSSLLPYLISLSSKLFCVGNEPNGDESNICFIQSGGYLSFYY